MRSGVKNPRAAVRRAASVGSDKWVTTRRFRQQSPLPRHDVVVLGNPAVRPVTTHAAVMGDPRLYLHLGDKVVHQSYEEWGDGVVVEEMTSSVPGGTCLVRIKFDDGRQRTFNNDMQNELCCYFFGVRKLWQVDREASDPPHRAARTSRRRLT